MSKTTCGCDERPDATGSYEAVWILSIGLSAVAALLNWPIDDRPVARLRAATA